MEQEDTRAALNNIAIAFAQLVEDYENQQQPSAVSPIIFGKSLLSNSQASRGISSRSTDDFFKSTSASIEALESAMNVVILGLDYRRYVKFQRLTPSIMSPRHKRDYVIYRSEQSEENSASMEDCRFCFDFVVECAIRLQDFAFEPAN